MHIYSPFCAPITKYNDDNWTNYSDVQWITVPPLLCLIYNAVNIPIITTVHIPNTFKLFFVLFSSVLFIFPQLQPIWGIVAFFLGSIRYFFKLTVTCQKTNLAHMHSLIPEYVTSNFACVCKLFLVYHRYHGYVLLPTLYFFTVTVTE